MKAKIENMSIENMSIAFISAIICSVVIYIITCDKNVTSILCVVTFSVLIIYLELYDLKKMLVNKNE